MSLLRRYGLVALPLAVLLVLAVGLYIGLTGEAEHKAVQKLDRQAPAFELAGLATRPGDKPAQGLSTADLKGGVDLVNVFASWCAPCRDEHPVLARLAQRDGLDLHGINYQDDPDAAGQWLARLGDSYDRIGRDPEGRTAIAFGITGVPETYIVDAAGKLRYKVEGPVTQRLVETALVPALREVGR